MLYGDAIREGFQYLLASDPSVLVIGQGLWSPWYVGNTMRDLEHEFGKDRVIDTPVSELACTGAAIGAALSGYRPIVTHPRVDFALLAVDQMVNQAAKWNSMFGGQSPVPVVFRLIVNRGGEQGAQHSQSLYSWFAHVPGLRVVTPGTAADARDLLIAAALSDDPVVYIDDRWLYDLDDDLGAPKPVDLDKIEPQVLRDGSDVTLVGFSWTSRLMTEAAELLHQEGIAAEVVDLRVLNPLRLDVVMASVAKTRRLVVAEGDWSSCGVAAEVICQCVTELGLTTLSAVPIRLNLAASPAPTSRPLEASYYPTVDDVVQAALTACDAKPRKETMDV
ncbi:MAG: transketolase C-terminal domain-containing protein [Ilumatobacteraceae bacterium]